MTNLGVNRSLSAVRSLWIVCLLLLVFSCGNKGEQDSDPCPASQLLCNGVCVDRQSANCASCGNPCSADQICDLGACKPKVMGCSAGLTDCGGCVDLRSNVNNCGACGKVCQVCDQGTCKESMQGCSAGLALCNGSCVDLKSSAVHCGACNHACDKCENGACKASEQSCSVGLTQCGGSCVDLQSSTLNCGACNQACGAGKVCSAGVCSCAPGTLACGGACVDAQTDSANCGACGNACTGGRSCLSGTCQCASGKNFCGSACADLQTDAANCGTCGNSCGPDKMCTGGQCVCAVGRAACGTACVDLQSSDTNCGACGAACSLGQVCTAGKCGGGGGLRDDGCQGLTANLTLSEIAVYQTVEVPIMKNGTDIAVSARNTDVVVGRDATFRLFLTTGMGFTAHELSGRVYIQNGTTIDTVYAKKTISGSTQPGSLDNSIQITVPKDKVNADTRYAVEVVDCGGAVAGTMQTPRFPATDGANLGARKTGSVKIKLVPMQANGMSPDTSDTALKFYRDYLLALYPATSIEFSLGTPMNLDDSSNRIDDRDWNAMLDGLTNKRSKEGIASDTYYYGLLKPAASLRAYCGDACTAGIGFVVPTTGPQLGSHRVAMGLAFADADSAETMAHEVGHNQGRDHAPCVPPGGQISGVDSMYPYTKGAIGVYGWDPRTSKLIAPDRTDIMGYCNNKWISDYTYDGLVNRIALLNSAAQSVYVPEELVHPWLVLLVEPGRIRFGLPITEPSAPDGEPESADILDAVGNVITTVTVYRTRVSDIDAASIQIPPPEVGWHSIRVLGAPEIAFK